MLKQRRRELILLTTLVMSAAACGVLDDPQEKAKTVDEAVNLLQELDDNSAWTFIEDGLDELGNQEEGYVLTVSQRESQEGNASASAEPTITLQVDAEGDALADITENGQTSTYFIEAFQAGDDPVVYRLEAGRYRCAPADSAGSRLRGGLNGLFEAYQVDTVGVRLLTVVERDEDGDESLAGRDAIRYRVESRVDDARDVLKRLDNDELQAQVENAAMVDFSGTLYLDEDTLALLRYESDLTDTVTQRRTEFVFEITAWGGVEAIPAPPANGIDTPCE